MRLSVFEKKTAEPAGADMQSLQEQAGIPTVFIEASGDPLPQAYRTLDALLGIADAAETLARYIEDTLTMAAAAHWTNFTMSASARRTTTT